MAYQFITDMVAVRKTDSILWQVASKMALIDPCLLLLVSLSRPSLDCGLDTETHL